MRIAVIGGGIRASYRKRNPIAEVFARYGAADYAGLIDEFQRRRAAGPLRLRPVALDS